MMVVDAPEISEKGPLAFSNSGSTSTSCLTAQFAKSSMPRR